VGQEGTIRVTQNCKYDRNNLIEFLQLHRRRGKNFLIYRVVEDLKNVINVAQKGKMRR
jgi:hypothetical protein